MLSVFDTRDDSSYTLGHWRWLRGLDVAPGSSQTVTVEDTSAAPAVVARGRCSGFLGEGDNIVGGQQANITLKPGETRELIVLLGLGTVKSHGRKTVARYGNSEHCEAEFQKLKQAWHAPLENLQVKTPDEDFDHMVNVWNAYNALITYAWSRSASLIYNGERDGLGFRDPVQDILGATALLKKDVQPRLDNLLSRLQQKIDELRRDLDTRASRSSKPPAGQIPPTGVDSPAGSEEVRRGVAGLHGARHSRGETGVPGEAGARPNACGHRPPGPESLPSPSPRSSRS